MNIFLQVSLMIMRNLGICFTCNFQYWIFDGVGVAACNLYSLLNWKRHKNHSFPASFNSKLESVDLIYNQ